MEFINYYGILHIINIHWYIKSYATKSKDSFIHAVMDN